MRLVQFKDGKGDVRVATVAEDGNSLIPLAGVAGTYGLAMEAANSGRSLADLVNERAKDDAVDYDRVVTEGRLLAPIHHPDPAHCFMTGTGLTHLGSASTRSSMHEKTAGDEEQLTDSMKMFKWGLEGGKPPPRHARPAEVPPP